MRVRESEAQVWRICGIAVLVIGLAVSGWIMFGGDRAAAPVRDAFDYKAPTAEIERMYGKAGGLGFQIQEFLGRREVKAGIILGCSLLISWWCLVVMRHPENSTKRVDGTVRKT